MGMPSPVYEVPAITLGGTLAHSMQGQELFPLPLAVATQPANPYIPLRREAPAQRSIATPATDTLLAQALDARGISIRAFAPTVDLPGAQLDACKATVERTLEALPQEDTRALQNLRLYYESRPSRGMANATTVELDCDTPSTEELTAVLVHELGHTVDLGVMTGDGQPTEFLDGSLPVLSHDPSVQFYRLSWRDSEQMKLGQTQADFVSGYAMANPFEDFAESFAFYVLQGDAFRQVITEDAVLADKYAYLRDTIFHGLEFDGGSSALTEGDRVWDTTLVGYDVAAFYTRGTRMSGK